MSDGSGCSVTDLGMAGVRSLMSALVSLEMVLEFLVVSLKTNHENTQAHCN